MRTAKRLICQTHRESIATRVSLLVSSSSYRARGVSAITRIVGTMLGAILDVITGAFKNTRPKKEKASWREIANLIIVKVRDKNIPYNKVRGKRVRGSTLFLTTTPPKRGGLSWPRYPSSRERSLSHPNCCRGIEDRRG